MFGLASEGRDRVQKWEAADGWWDLMNFGLGTWELQRSSTNICCECCEQHLSMKEGRLFCFVCSYEIHWTGMLQIVFLVSLESSSRGAWAWFHGVWTCGAKVLEYWMISSLKIQLNCSWKFRRNWNVPLVLLERPWQAGSHGIYLVRFGFRMWETLILKWFQPLKIQINSN